MVIESEIRTALHNEIFRLRQADCTVDVADIMEVIKPLFLEIKELKESLSWHE